MCPERAVAPLDVLPWAVSALQDSDPVFSLELMLYLWPSNQTLFLPQVCGDPSKQQQALIQMHFQGLHLYSVVVYDFAQGCQVPAGHQGTWAGPRVWACLALDIGWGRRHLGSIVTPHPQALLVPSGS